MSEKFSLAPLERIAKKSGVKRISVNALVETRDMVVQRAEEIAARAVTFSKHAKRVTIKKEDIRLASK